MIENKMVVVSMAELCQVWKGLFKEALTEVIDVKQKEIPKAPYTKKEVKRLFNVTYQTLDRWHANGILTHYNVGRRIYYHPEIVNALLDDKKNKG